MCTNARKLIKHDRNALFSPNIVCEKKNEIYLKRGTKIDRIQEITRSAIVSPLELDEDVCVVVNIYIVAWILTPTDSVFDDVKKKISSLVVVVSTSMQMRRKKKRKSTITLSFGI